MLDLILIEFSLLEYFSKSNINTVLIFEKGKFYHFLSAWNKYFKFTKFRTSFTFQIKFII